MNDNGGSSSKDARVSSPKTDHRRASRMGILAIADQCLFSGTNFLTAVIVGRIAGQRELGVYSLVFSIVMIALALQRSLLIAPYVVLRDQVGPSRSRSMKSTIMSLTFAAGLMTSVVGIALGYFTGNQPALLLALAIPAGFLRDFARQLALTEFRFSTAFWIDGWITVCQIGGLLLVVQWFAMPLTATAVLTWSSVCWMAVGIPAVILVLRTDVRPPTDWITDFKTLFAIGRWVSLSQVASTVQSFLMPWILAAFHSLELAGVYAACWALVQVVSPAIEGLGNLLGPALARSASRGDWDELASRLRLATIVFSLVMGGMLIGVLLAGRFALEAFYGESYANYSSVLVILSLAAAIGNIGIPTSKLLTQVGRARSNVAAMLLSITAVCITSIACLRWLGPSGAAWGLVAGSSLSTLARWLWLRWVRHDVAMQMGAENPSEHSIDEPSEHGTLAITSVVSAEAAT